MVRRKRGRITTRAACRVSNDVRNELFSLGRSQADTVGRLFRKISEDLNIHRSERIIDVFFKGASIW